MIFGKSHKERIDQRQEKLKKLQKKNQWFAWYPVRENYGKFVWFQKVRIDYAIYEYHKSLEKAYEKPIYHLIKKQK